MRITKTQSASPHNDQWLSNVLGGPRSATYHQIFDSNGDEYAVFVTDRGEVISAVVYVASVELCPTGEG